MDCATVHERLDAWLAGELPAGERRAVDAHLDACPDCREIVALARTEPVGAGVEPSSGFAREVLARTVGSPCGGARAMLPGAVDRAPTTVEDDLVRLHVETCEECTLVYRVLARMRVDLPPLAACEPDAAFVGDVLAATARSQRRAAYRGGRLAEAVRHLFARPRVAWEFAYVGTFVLTLALLPPSSPLAGLPDRMLLLARINPVEKLGAPAHEFELRIRDGARDVWRDTRRTLTGVAEVAVERTRREAGTLWDRHASENETAEDATPDAREPSPNREGERE